MTEFKFAVNPAPAGDAALAANPLTNIKQAVAPPAGAHRDVLVAMGYPFADLPLGAYRTSLISDVYFRLKDAGLLDKLDWFYLATGDIDGSLINLIPGKRPALNNGSTYSTGAIHTDGVGDHFAANLALNKERYTLNSACVFVHLTATPPAGTTLPIIANSGDGYSVRLNRNSGSPYIQARLNSESVTLSAISSSLWGSGLWTLNRPSATVFDVYKDGTAIAGSTTSMATSLPPDIWIGRGNGGDVYTAQAFSSFGGGGGLTADDVAALAAITAFHASAIAALDAA